MARLPRLTVPGYAHHLIQRGNNRQAIFQSDNDRKLLMELLREHADAQQVALHAYVLMDNHFHLLATPETVEGIPRMMQAIGRRYVRNFNLRYARTGTLWEGRYKSTLVQTEKYLLACMVYMDLNPVRAGIVQDPEDYLWSSHLHYVGRRSEKWLSPHPLYWELGNTPFSREQGYAELVRGGVAADSQRKLTEATLRGWALGDAGFSESLQRQTSRRISRGQAGRPAKEHFDLSPIKG